MKKTKKEPRALASLKIEVSTHRKLRAFVAANPQYNIGGLAASVIENYLKAHKAHKAKARRDGSDR